MPSKGRPIIIIDRYTMNQIARYPSVKDVQGIWRYPRTPFINPSALECLLMNRTLSTKTSSVNGAHQSGRL